MKDDKNNRPGSENQADTNTADANPTLASRRQFFKVAGTAGFVAGTLASADDAVAGALPTPRASMKKFTGGKFPKAKTLARGRVLGANDRVMMAHIGLGGMGTSHLQDFVATSKEWNVQSIAICDAYQVRLDRGKNIVLEGAKGCGDVQVESDYRRVLENKDIDAVLIATPEHWHSQIAVDAMEAGKHIYVEKPMSRFLDEAFQIYDAQKRTGRIVAVGAQGCSEPTFLEAKKILTEGKLGPLVSVQTSYCRNSRDGEWNYKIDAEAGPDNLDWDMWLGSAPKRKWDEDSKSRFFRYRKYRDYSSGILGDLMPHKIYPSLMATGKMEYPKRVSCIGTRQISTDREVADSVHVLAEFPSGWTFIFVGSTVNEQGLNEMMRGNHATLYAAGGNIQVSPERPYAEEMDSVTINLPDPGNRHHGHRANFLSSIRENRAPNCDMELGIRGQALISMAEISEMSGRTVEFDERRRTWKFA